MSTSPTRRWCDLDPKEQEKVLREVLTRIASALASNTLPTLSDAALFEQSVLIYQHIKGDNAGYRPRASKPSTIDLRKVSGPELRHQASHVANCLIHRIEPDDDVRRDFLERLSAYLAGEISAAKLLGSQRKKPHQVPFRLFMGYLVDRALHLLERDSESGGSRKPSERLSTQNSETSVFKLMSELGRGKKPADLSEQFSLREGAVPILAALRNEMMDEAASALATDDELDLLQNTYSWAECYQLYRLQSSQELQNNLPR